MNSRDLTLEHYYAVIMAGGGGTRLWPLSRQARPKQMIPLLDDRTLFQTAVRRLDGLFPPERIYVVTVNEQAAGLQAQCPEIPLANYLIEPVGRGTASVVGLAAVALQKRDPAAIMAVLASDHFMGNVPLFVQLLKTARKAAEAGYLMTLGIEPTFPAIGFGYIQKGQQLEAFDGQSIYQVAKFKEKPSQAEAAAMLATGSYAWNSGMFIWQVGDILAEIRRQMPYLAAGLSEIDRAWDSPQRNTTIERVWSVLKSETIDYGIMENAHRVAVLPGAGLDWSDVGSWDSMFEVLPVDQDGNIVLGGKHVGLQTAKSLIYIDQPDRLIVTIGIQDLVVVDTDDVLLICSRDQAQQVRQVVNRLRTDGQEYL